MLFQDELTSLNVAARGNHIEVVKALLARPEIDVKLVDYVRSSLECVHWVLDL